MPVLPVEVVQATAVEHPEQQAQQARLIVAGLEGVDLAARAATAAAVL